MKKIIFAVAVLALLAACRIIPPPMPTEPDDTDKCPDACRRLRELGCPEGAPLADGSSCESFCVETQEAGHSLNLSCVTGIKNCEELSTKCWQ